MLFGEILTHFRLCGKSAQAAETLRLTAVQNMLLLFLFYDDVEMGIKTHLEIIKCSMRAVFKFPSQGKGTFALRKDLKVLKDTVCSFKRDPGNLLG